MINPTNNYANAQEIIWDINVASKIFQEIFDD